MGKQNALRLPDCPYADAQLPPAPSLAETLQVKVDWLIKGAEYGSRRARRGGQVDVDHNFASTDRDFNCDRDVHGFSTPFGTAWQDAPQQGSVLWEVQSANSGAS